VMISLKTLAKCFFTVMLLGNAGAALPNNPGILRFPDVDQTRIVFVYAGDLWIVPKAGGTAVRLTNAPGPRAIRGFLMTAKQSASREYITVSTQFPRRADKSIESPTMGAPPRFAPGLRTDGCYS